MKEYNTLNKRPEINVYPMQKMRYQISGKILYMTSCVKNITFILTSEDSLYVIDNSKEKNAIKYTLHSSLDQKSKSKYQTNEIESQIWCHKLGTHAIIKYKNDIFYYNPHLLKEKVQELNFFYEDKYLQPYAVAFDDDYFEPNDTGEILFSDYNSDIYKLQITISGQNVVRVFGRVFGLKEYTGLKNNLMNNENTVFNFFSLNKNDRILDMKLIYSSKNNILSANKGTEGKSIIIMAITNNILFQFHGKDSIENVFENYSIENGSILKGYKLFLGNDKIENFKFSKMQFINQYLLSSKEKEKDIEEIKSGSKGILFGFMTKSGYCLGRLNNLYEYKPQNNFTIFSYASNLNNLNNDQENLKGRKNKNIPNIIKVCQSVNHIFFLYKERLIILNKLTNRIIHLKYLTEVFIDMFYDEIQNGIFLYNGNHVYKIGLEHEFKYLWIDYVEVGNYELALKTVTSEDKNMKTKLHKLYAEYLYKEKRYVESAKEYAFSEEIFEDVCLKFLLVNNIKALITYLALINHFRIRPNSPKKFLQKYLINTWLFELLIGKKENADKGDLISNIKDFMRDSKHGDDYINKLLVYYILKIYGRFDEYIEFGTIKQEYNEIIVSLITFRKVKDALDFIKMNVLYGVDTVKDLLKKLFFKYATIFMKQNPIETIELLDKYFIVNSIQNISDIFRLLRLLNSIRINDIVKDEQKYQILVNYIQKQIEKPIKTENKEFNFAKNTNLHNLYILLLSYQNKNMYEDKLINYLKKPIILYNLDQSLKRETSINNYINFDLYFAKKIFSDNPSALSLIYFLLSRYNEGIEIALKCNLKDIYKLIASNISNLKLKKQLWLKVFEFQKKEGFSEARQIVNESDGLIKIEDILPLMGDNVKIGEFKEELKDCINSYEKSVELLNKEIKEFNISTNLIQKDISKATKNVFNVNYNKIRCQECGNVIKEKKFFMFPCKHIFDSHCLINKYIEFSKQGIGDQKFKSKVKAINDLITKINILSSNKMKDDTKSVGSNNSKRLPNIKGIFKSETLIPKDVNFEQQENNQLNLFNKGLYDFLDEECILCGKEVIQATQIPFSEQNSLDWEIA